MTRRILDNRTFESFEDMLKYFIDVYGAMFFKREDWLSPREKEFFYHLVLLSREGINLASKEAVSRLRETFNSKKTDRSVWIYRGKLKKIGWLIQTKDSLVVPPAFLKDFNKVHFNINIDYSEFNRRNQESGDGILQRTGEGAPVPDNEARRSRGT